MRRIFPAAPFRAAYYNRIAHRLVSGLRTYLLCKVNTKPRRDFLRLP